jgi:hypothetical protein
MAIGQLVYRYALEQARSWVWLFEVATPHNRMRLLLGKRQYRPAYFKGKSYCRWGKHYWLRLHDRHHINHYFVVVRVGQLAFFCKLRLFLIIGVGSLVVVDICTHVVVGLRRFVILGIGYIVVRFKVGVGFAVGLGHGRNN